MPYFLWKGGYHYSLVFNFPYRIIYNCTIIFWSFIKQRLMLLTQGRRKRVSGGASAPYIKLLQKPYPSNYLTPSYGLVSINLICESTSGGKSTQSNRIWINSSYYGQLVFRQVRIWVRNKIQKIWWGQNPQNTPNVKLNSHIKILTWNSKLVFVKW